MNLIFLAITKEDLEFSVGSKQAVWEVKDPLLSVSLILSLCMSFANLLSRTRNTWRTTLSPLSGVLADRLLADMAVIPTIKVTPVQLPSTHNNNNNMAPDTATGKGSMGITTRFGQREKNEVKSTYRRVVPVTISLRMT
jgi:hypothetical protein